MGRKTFRDLEIDKPDQQRQGCRFWLFGGKCGQVDAPKPATSRCIGTRACDNWEWRNPRGYSSIKNIAAEIEARLPATK